MAWVSANARVPLGSPEGAGGRDGANGWGDADGDRGCGGPVAAGCGGAGVGGWAMVGAAGERCRWCRAGCWWRCEGVQGRGRVWSLLVLGGQWAQGRWGWRRRLQGWGQVAQGHGAQHGRGQRDHTEHGWCWWGRELRG